MWVAIAVFVALQLYFVQEMLAALILFTGVFIIFAIISLILYLVDRAGEWGLEWLGQRARPALPLARRGWHVVAAVSKKLIRHPHSEPAQ